MTAASNIPQNARWAQIGITVVGGHGKGNASNQLCNPFGIYVDDDQTILVADFFNNRIIEWKPGTMNGEVVAGGKGPGNRMDQLNRPSDVIVDKQTNSLIICDRGNGRVIRWPRGNRANGEIIINNIDCMGLTMDDQNFLYVSDTAKHEVRRYRAGEPNGIVVAGGNGRGNNLNQLDHPSYIFVDRNYSVYVSEWGNHRVMKWMKDAEEGIIVAGGRGRGNNLMQLSIPEGVFVDLLGTVYVADFENHRVMRWCNGETQGNVIVGGNGQGNQGNQLNYPWGLSFDKHGNLYVADNENNRIQRFSIEM